MIVCPSATISSTSPERSRIQSSACRGGVMSSPHEQNTTIGDLMLRKSTRSPRDVRICPLESLLPTNRLSRDPLHLARIQQDRVSPPSLEGEEPLRFGVDLRIDVVWLGPIGVGRVEGLEIRH